MTALRIAYHTTDEVNLDSALMAANEYGAALLRLPDPYTRPGPSFAATLYDLDHMDLESRQAIVSDLLSQSAPLPVAVHGYNLEDEEMKALHANGVLVSRQFAPEVVRALCQACESSGAAVPDPEKMDSQGTTEDPAVLCGMVRSLAAHTNRAFHRTSDESPTDLLHGNIELQERIAQVQEQIDLLRRQHDLKLEDLQRWLDVLRRQVKGTLVSSARSAEE